VPLALLCLLHAVTHRVNLLLLIYYSSAAPQSLRRILLLRGCTDTCKIIANYTDKQCTGTDGALAPLLAATRCAHECMKGSVRGVTPLTMAVVQLPVAEPAPRQALHALSSGKGGGEGPPPSQEGPLLARAQPEDSTPLLRALPPPLRRVERSSAV
jgi:hypothetical protein